MLGTPGSYPGGAGSTCSTSENDRTKLALHRESTAAEQGVARATGSLGSEYPSCSVEASTSDVGKPVQLENAMDVPYYVVTSATSWEDYTASVEQATTGTAHRQAVSRRRGQKYRSSAVLALSLFEFKHVDAVPARYEPGGPSSRSSPFSVAQGGSRRAPPSSWPRLWGTTCWFAILVVAGSTEAV